MSNDNLMYLLTILLIVSVVILFILIFVFIVITLKKKKERNKDIEKDSKEGKAKATPSIKIAKEYTTQDIKNFMEFDEIKDNMIVQDNGKRLIMVVQCQGINYDLMSSIEKISVEQGFVQFLNTLTRPIQLYIQSRKVNLEESLQNYKKRLKNIEVNYNKIKFQYQQAQKNKDIKNEQLNKIKFEYIRQKNLYEYTKDIINNTEKMSLNKNILTKNYYIVISYYVENDEELFQKEELLDMAFSELYTNAQSILRVLSVCGITGKVLNSTELADLLYVAYNRDASEVYGVDKAIKAEYDALYVTAPDVMEKKIAELDKMINEKALDLANSSIETALINSKRKKELEEKEKNMKELIQSMAKSMIEENEEYLGREIKKEAIEVIEQIKKSSKKKQEKGA